MKLYSSLADWWPLLSAPADYALQAAEYSRVMAANARRPIQTLLELGCGGGNNASYLKRRYQLTLTDASPEMLAISRTANPEVEHVQGDMRSLRLDRQFDAVFVHDAVMYMRSEADLSQAMGTAFVHCAAGGIALFVPDCTRETWIPSTSHGGHDGDGRALRYLQWDWDPDPADTQTVAEMVYLLREGGGPPRIEFDRHQLGLFPRAIWLGLLEQAGFQAHQEKPANGKCETGEMFVGVRP